MKLVIDIDEDYYEIVKHLVNVEHSDFKPYKIIAKGKPLLKGYGDLKDVNDLEECVELVDTNSDGFKYVVRMSDIRDFVPTIIEADIGDK